MPRARRQSPHCHSQHTGDQAEQRQDQHQRSQSPFRPCRHGRGQLRLHPSWLVRWRLGFGHFRRADNYLFHANNVRQTSGIDWGRTIILLDISSNCKAKTYGSHCGINAQPRELNTATGYMQAVVCAELFWNWGLAREPPKSTISQKLGLAGLQDRKLFPMKKTAQHLIAEVPSRSCRPKHRLPQSSSTLFLSPIEERVPACPWPTLLPHQRAQTRKRCSLGVPDHFPEWTR
jgi:hypothetical protein